MMPSMVGSTYPHSHRYSQLEEWHRFMFVSGPIVTSSRKGSTTSYLSQKEFAEACTGEKPLPRESNQTKSNTNNTDCMTKITPAVQ
jgi:hypothetical protein